MLLPPTHPPFSLKLHTRNPKSLLPILKRKRQLRIPHPHLDIILRHIIRFQAPPLTLEACSLLDMCEVGGDGAQFLHGRLDSCGWDVGVAADEGVAPGCEGLEGAVETVIY